ncbi:hypothetical protein J3Q64DRAFT_1047982 [Phycomyces blakesleeanus]|uniref:Uncharacterized protein n=1 Tax=Phycomyces blakesleeanus TaxID=4837 RepID=A0ABR3BHZ8_PHYBL
MSFDKVVSLKMSVLYLCVYVYICVRACACPFVCSFICLFVYSFMCGCVRVELVHQVYFFFVLGNIYVYMYMYRKKESKKERGDNYRVSEYAFKL